MALRVSSKTGLGSRTASVRSARVLSRSAVAPVRPRTVAAAGLKDWANWFGDSFVRWFTPADDNGVNWKGTATGFDGKIDHSRKPFRDGVNKIVSTNAQAATSQEALTPSVSEEGSDDAVKYIEGALGRVIGHNFTGDATEPDWKETGNKGWSGDVKRPRDRDQGFHSKIL